MKRILYLQTRQTRNGFNEACSAISPEISFYPGIPETGSQTTEGGELYLELSCTRTIFKTEEKQIELFYLLTESFEWEGSWVLTDRPEWARALCLKSKNVFASGKSLFSLQHLPIDRLGELGDPAEVSGQEKERRRITEFLKKVGIETIGDFANLAEDAVHHRFGAIGLGLLHWVRGEKPWVPRPLRGDTPLREEIDAEDIESLDALLFTLRQALVRLEARLRVKALCAQEIIFTFSLQSKETFQKKLVLSEPLRDAASLLRLLRDFLASLSWGSALKNISIFICRTERFNPGQLDLFDGSEARFADLSFYVTRLRLLLGEDRAGVASPQASYLPERSWSYALPNSSKNKKITHSFLPTPHRPIFVFSFPKPCTVDGSWKLKLAEKVAAEWWSAGGKRTYYVATTPHGDRYWIFRDEDQKRWFIQGTFD